MNISGLIDAFVSWCKRHRALATVKFYSQRLRLFRKKFGARGIDSLCSLEIDEYLHEVGQEQSDTTRHHNAVALTTLQSFALREKLLKERWFEKLDKPRIARRERIPDAAEIGRLLAKAPPEFRLIYQALCESGARPGELVRARVEDVDWKKRAIILKEHKTARKTGKPRVIVIGKAFEKTLRRAIGEHTAGAVFCSPAGKAWTVDVLSGMHRRLRDAAGLDPSIVLYSARHRFGTEAIRAGVPIKDVSEMMGHRSVTTTEIYLHRDVTELGDAQDKLPELPAHTLE